MSPQANASSSVIHPETAGSGLFKAIVVVLIGQSISGLLSRSEVCGNRAVRAPHYSYARRAEEIVPHSMTNTSLPFSAAADRNKTPILEVLQRWLPARARVLEIASGTGQHAAHFAAAHPAWTWQPTEANAEWLPPIAQRCAPFANVLAPLPLDVMAPTWGVPAD